MSVNLREDRKILAVKLTGKLTTEDYEQFIPEVERRIKRYGRLRILVELSDFHGWTAGALWQDVKFDLKHFRDIERLALVGDKTWERGMAAFCAPFTTAEIRYFETGEVEQAEAWIHADPWSLKHAQHRRGNSPPFLPRGERLSTGGRNVASARGSVLHPVSRRQL